MRVTTFVLIVGMSVLVPGAVIAGQAHVEVRRGLGSAMFDATPVLEVFNAIRRGTGVELVVSPTLYRERSLTLAVEKLPFELYLRRVLDALDVGGYAIVYETSGTGDRIIVVDRSARGEPPASWTAGAPIDGESAGGRRADIPPPVDIPL